MKRVLLYVTGALLFILVVMAGLALFNARDRSPDYRLDLTLPDNALSDAVGPLRIGVAKAAITPVIQDTWVDADNNARYEPDKGDSFIDNNGNGQFDGVWLAGFHHNRPAQGVHDEIWARAVVWDNGQVCVALVVLDAIGFFHDDVLDVRGMVANEDWPIDHVIVAATHNHEVPDLMGLWGPGMFRTGVDEGYMRYVKEQAVNAIGRAVANRRPAILKLATIDSTAADLVRDSRPPVVLDNAMHLMQFCDAVTLKPFGMLVNWGNHPETAGSDNLLVTADYPHYWLKGIEEGIIYDGQVKQPGIGGIAIFVNGAIGGLMTSLGSTIYDPWLQTSYKANGFEKVRTQGYRLAKLVLDHVVEGGWETVADPLIVVRAKTFLFDLDNVIFKLGGALGILNRGFIDFKYLRSEVDLVKIGPAWLLMIPGEINPEIINGGIENPDGADYPGEPVEVPALRMLMQGDYNFVCGLANDEVGYIMPRSHWDVETPFTYDYKKRPYAEINSLGPETGPTLYREAKAIIDDMIRWRD
jgi:hypothetical protein